MYVKIIDGEIVKAPYSVSDMRMDNPELEVSPHPSDEELAACNAKRVTIVPTYVDQKAFRLKPVFSLDDDGEATLSYESEQIAADAAGLSIRAVRDKLIAATDWVVTRSAETGKPVPANYVAYRQALRDLPSQKGFPYKYVWPVLGE